MELFFHDQSFAVLGIIALCIAGIILTKVYSKIMSKLH